MHGKLLISHSSPDSRVRVRSPGCFMYHCEHWSGPGRCVTYFGGQELESGPRVYCVLCHALHCTVPGPARAVRHLQRGVLSA